MLRTLVTILALLPVWAMAQAVPAADDSAILTIVPDRLFAETKAGRAAEAKLEAASQTLMTENRRIEAELEGEERDLTARRDTVPTTDFRQMADAFDAKAERIRGEQDAKSRRITRMREEERQIFFKAAVPVLASLMQEEGAKAILDRSSVFLSFDLIDVTDRAIARVDAELGDGTALYDQDGAAGP